VIVKATTSHNDPLTSWDFQQPAVAHLAHAGEIESLGTDASQRHSPV